MDNRENFRVHRRSGGSGVRIAQRIIATMTLGLVLGVGCAARAGALLPVIAETTGTPSLPRW